MLSLAMYAIPDVYAKERQSRFLFPSRNKRGSALAYCLKLLIGLRTDAAFPRYAVSLSLSLSPSVALLHPPRLFDFLLSPGPSGEGSPGRCVRFCDGISAVHNSVTNSTSASFRVRGEKKQ